MNTFDDLYQEIVLDHYRSPRNKARLDNVPESMVHENPSCGDAIKLEVTLDDSGKVTGIRFDGRGCAISTASASLMTEKLRGLTVEEARSVAHRFIRSLRGDEPLEELDNMGDLVAFKGVAQFPVRVKCATLAWHALLLSLPEVKGTSAA
ncbi:MAG: Fe-S cluster assembly sulfur transfer protein SufU [Spirochaetia bacterium]